MAGVIFEELLVFEYEHATFAGSVGFLEAFKTFLGEIHVAIGH